jgi:hypothetical protein
LPEGKEAETFMFPVIPSDGNYREESFETRRCMTLQKFPEKEKKNG